MKKKGILGGTFDPIHLAHEQMGLAAMRELSLDEIVVMPTGNQYLKTVHSHVTRAKHREAMVKLAIQDVPGFTYSDMEILRGGYTYTADTLRELIHREPDTQWYYILGADSLHGMRRWFAPEVICRHAELVAAARREQMKPEQMEEDIAYLKERYGARIHTLILDPLPASSTQIRKEIREGRLPHPYLKPAVNEYIREHGLYGPQRSEEEILASLKVRLKPSRYQHTLGVAETAVKLAESLGTVSPEKARLAGVLHDCGKYEGDALTHAPLGAVIAREDYGITDEDILSAIRWHTTGRPAMTDLEKIIFVADYIEPGRDRAPRLEMLRKLAFTDLDKTIVCILEDTLSYLRNCGAFIDDSSLQTYNYYHQKIRGEEG